MTAAFERFGPSFEAAFAPMMWRFASHAVAVFTRPQAVRTSNPGVNNVSNESAFRHYKTARREQTLKRPQIKSSVLR
jgi:hypothetical protein